MSRNDHIRYNNHDWKPVTQSAPDYAPVDLKMVEFQPETEVAYRELMFRKALGMGYSYGNAREYSDGKSAKRAQEVA